ncbi:hypothetical protein AWZ03_008514 [Drosophila navojoa]|uniref:Uncharacterized protein n=1 Tax=Drosophila navojoa TaxID=7232 RepID=A0A484B8W0_DRONA|nr:uncharacterized protein LOC108660357 [Drosophila navojoa]TDG45089.1 hypothetical protein AWZ03_008514 [Drosophila navojoa]
MLQSNRVLLKEQTHLYAIERKLVKALPIIQETLNSLKVEELHLKSNSVHQAVSMEPSNVGMSREICDQSMNTPNEQINCQEIDLQLFENDLQQFGVEIESD